MMRPFISFLFLSCSVVSLSGLDARAWQTVNGKMNFPEKENSYVTSRPNTAISFSGGGSRAYLTAMGLLAGFHKLGLVENIGYMIGVSGGSWATIVYSYYQNQSVSDTTLLGEVIEPSKINYNDLKKMDSKCVRGFTNAIVQNDMDPSNSATTLGQEEDASYFETWSKAVQDAYLNPSGIARRKYFSLDSNSVKSIIDRNPSLTTSEFYTMRSSSSNIASRPFPIVSSTMVGPMNTVPIGLTNRNFTILEFTPLSAGVSYTRDLLFQTPDKSVSYTATVGGLIEPFAYGGQGPTQGMNSKDITGHLSVPKLSTPLDLNYIISASSFYSGCELASNKITASTTGQTLYWSPSSSTPSKSQYQAAIGDGGGLQIDNLISLLQRKINKIILVCSTSVPIQPPSVWNPQIDTFSQSFMDFDIPSFFGILPNDLSDFDAISYDLSQSQVFSSSEWIPLAKQFQLAQDIGNGTIVTSTLKTIANPYHGIPAGLEVTVTWVYLTRVKNWEKQLSSEMKKYVIPTSDPENPASLITSGPFKSFPHYPTDFAGINFEQANLLADLMGWVVLNNEKTFRQLLK